MINEDISQQDLYKVLRAKRRRTRPVPVESVAPTPEPKAAAKPAVKPESQADK